MSTASTRRDSLPVDGSPSSPKMLDTLLLGGAQRDHERVGDPLIRASDGHQLEDLVLSGRQRGERVVASPPREPRRDDDRIERRAAGGDAPHRRDELPASLKMLGGWNWYLPSWLEWLPRVGAERDALPPVERGDPPAPDEPAAPEEPKAAPAPA